MHDDSWKVDSRFAASIFDGCIRSEDYSRARSIQTRVSGQHRMLWLQSFLLARILALRAQFKVSGMTDLGLESQNDRDKCILCGKARSGARIELMPGANLELGARSEPNLKKETLCGSFLAFLLLHWRIY